MVLRSKTTAGFTELSCELLVTSDSSVHTRGCFFPLSYKHPQAQLQRLWEDSCVCPHRGAAKCLLVCVRSPGTASLLGGKVSGQPLLLIEFVSWNAIGAGPKNSSVGTVQE